MDASILDSLNAATLNRRITVTLPSKGLFYDENVVSDKLDPDDIPIRALSMLEENSLLDPLLILSGKATESVIKALVPGIKKVGSMAIIDVQAVLMASRIATRGENYEVTVSCEKCKQEGHKSDFDVTINLLAHLAKMQPLTNDDLPFFHDKIGKLHVYFRPPIFQSVIDTAMALAKANVFDEDAPTNSEIFNEEFIQKYLNRSTVVSEVSVGYFAGYIRYLKIEDGEEVHDQETIQAWLENAPSPVIDQIAQKVKEIDARFEDMLTADVECKRGHKVKVSLNLDTESLFSPAGYSKTRKNTPAGTPDTGKIESTS
ncbi:MAG: hypothetical protein D6698_14055 [Gammaproteobacteria bacterium]|nr:MAG: hypothetical protein D6698_14055 [Gammaproteobacteria bacterium]